MTPSQEFLIEGVFVLKQKHLSVHLNRRSFHFIGFFVFLVSVLQPVRAHAECSVGVTLFRDTLYGTGVGFVVGGLVLLAKGDDKDIVQQLATASLIGTGVGAVVGIADVALNPCTRKDGSKGLQIPHVVLHDAHNVGIGFRYVLN
jgi:hypothetical protein